MGVGSLGAASFEFAIDSSRFVQGFTNMGASAAGFASKFVPGMGSIATGLKKLDDGLFNVTKTGERYTRWIRDTSPEMRRANEWLYTYRQEQSRLEQQMKTSEMRLQSAMATHDSYTNKIKLQTAIVKERESEEKRLQAILAQSEAQLAKAQAGGNAKTIADATAKVNQFKLALDTAAASTKVAKDRLEGLAQGQKVAGEQVELVKQRLKSLAEQQHRVNNSYELQEERIKSLKEKRKIEKLEIEQAIAAGKKMYDSQGRLININMRFGASFGNNFGVLNRFQQACGKAAQGVVHLTQKLGGIGTIAIGTVLGTAIQGVAMSTQGMVNTALTAFRANERLNLSLKELVATELQQKNSGLDRAAALQQAGIKTQELIKWTQDLAIKSPFSQEGVANAFQMSKALGFTVAESQRLTTTMVDWASATGKTEAGMQRVILALGQMQAKGKVSGDELLQLTEAGLPVRDILAKAFGKTTEEIVKMQEKGLIPAKDAIAAIAESLDKDYAGAGLRASSSMDGLLNSLQDLTTVSLREFFTGTFQAIQPYIQQFVDTVGDPAVIGSIREIGGALGSVLGAAMGFLSGTAIPALIEGFNYLYPSIMAGVSQIAYIADAAYEWGAGLMNQYGQGIIDAASYVIDAVMEIASVIADWIAPHSPPPFLPKIQKWGREAFQMYADGAKQVDVATPLNSLGGAIKRSLQSDWNVSDFTLFKDLQGELKNFLDEAVAGGQMADLDLIPAMLGTGDVLAQAVEEIKNVGRVSNETFAAIHDAAGPVGEDFEQFARAMLKTQTATKALQAAQESLNATTKKYDAQLNPLYDKLNKIQNVGAKKQQDKELKYLKELMTLQNVPGLSMDKDNLQAQIDAIETERQIAAIEEQRDVEIKAGEEKIKAAEEALTQAEAEYTFRQDMIAAQREQNALIREQIALVEEQKEKEEAEKEGKKGKKDASADKAAREEEQRARAEFEARLAEAETEEEKLQILQEWQSRYAEGSKEYLDLRKRIAAQEDKVTKAREDEANQTARASEKAFDHALALADEADKVQMLEERLASLDPTSEEYIKRKQQLEKALEAQGKAEDRLFGKEEQAMLAGMDRAEKIDYYREKLGGLQEGTEEYYDTLAKLTSLEQQEANAAASKARAGAGKGKADAPKPGSLFKGNPLDSLKTEIDAATTPLKTLGTRFSEFFDKVNARVNIFKSNVQSAMNPINRFTSFLDQNRAVLGALAGVLTVIAAHQGWLQLGLLIMRLAPLFAALGSAIAFVLSPMGLIMIAAAALGAIWATNFGGIQQIVQTVWNIIGPKLELIVAIISRIVAVFQEGGIVAGFKALLNALPALGSLIQDIFASIWKGVLGFVNSEDMQKIIGAITAVLQGAWNWLIGTGLPWALNALSSAWTWLKGKLAEWVPLAIAWVQGMIPIVIGKLGALAGQAISYLVTEAPKWFSSAKTAGGGIFEWISGMVSPLLSKLGDLIATAMAWLGPRILPALEVGLNKLLDFVIMAGNWILQTGLPHLVNMLANVVNWLAEYLPPLIGKALVWIGTYGPIILTELTRIILSLLQRLGIWLISSAIPNLLTLIIVNVPRLLQAALNLILNTVNSIAQALPAIVFGLALGLGRLVMQALAFVSNLLIAVIVNVPQYLLLLLAGVAAVIWNALVVIGKLVWTGLNIVVGLFISIFSGIAGLIAGFVWGMIDAGRMLIEGLWNGIRDAWPWLADRLNEWWTGFITWIKTFLGIASPSKLFQDMGTFIVEGLRLGLELVIGVFIWVQDQAVAWVNWLLEKWDFHKAQAMQLWTQFVLDLKALVQEKIDWLTNKITAWVKWAIEKWTELKAKATDLWNGLKDAVVSAATALKDKVTEMVNAARDAMSAAWESAKNTASDAWNKAGGIVSNVSDSVSKVKDVIANFFTGEGDGTLRGLVSKGWDWVSDKIGQSGDSIGEAMQRALRAAKNKMIDAINDVIDVVNEAVDAINELSSAVGGPTIDRIDHIGRYAMGTMFAPGGMALVGEDGPEIVHLPRGAEVKTSSRTQQMFDVAAQQMTAQVNATVDRAMAVMSRSLDQAVSRLVGAVEQSKPSLEGATERVVNNTVTTIKKEEHHHWHMTVHTQATTSTVVDDYATMQAYSGLAS
jgi:tape measure domain-containing protein